MLFFFKCIFLLHRRGEIFFVLRYGIFNLSFFCLLLRSVSLEFFFILLSITLLSSFHFQDNVFRMLINFFCCKKNGFFWSILGVVCKCSKKGRILKYSELRFYVTSKVILHFTLLHTLSCILRHFNPVIFI